MKKLLVTLAVALLSASAFAQNLGTVNMQNNNLTAADGSTYNAPITGDTTSATAQLFVQSGGNLTALTPTTTFRQSPAAAKPFLSAVVLDVPGTTPGGSATFVLRAWVGADFASAAQKGESAPFTVAGLGGTPASGPPLTPPNLNGLQSFPIVPEPSTIALGVLGAAALLIRRRK
jgi:hypothetical protein